MEEEISVNTDVVLEATHFFVYKGKRYPFNMKLFKCFSQYFQINKRLFKDTTDINLDDELNEKIPLTESTINDFIDFCHSKVIKLTNENAISLHRLSKKFNIPTLNKATSKFILKHQKETIVEFLLLIINDDKVDTSEYEEMISNDMTYYIKDDRLLLLPLPTLYRIIKKYEKNKNDENQDEVTEFLFKCLDHFGRPASVLFENHSFGKNADRFLSRLHQKYNCLFDFHFINNQELATVYLNESDIIGRTAKLMQVIEQMKGESENQNRTKDSQIKQMEEKIKQFDLKMQKMNEDKDSKIEKMEEKIKQLNELVKKMAEDRANEIDQVKRQQEEKIRQIQSDFQSQLDFCKSKTKKVPKNVTDDSRKPSLSCRFNGDSDPQGIIAAYKSTVKLSAGGKHHSSYPLSYLLTYDDKYFFNYYGFKPRSESDSFIEFDFGPHKKIHLHSYFIRSNDSDESVYDHPKTWRIVGSNGISNWIQLDRQVNNPKLNGKHKHGHFECQTKLPSTESSRFRYIRYIQEDSWSQETRPYYVWLTYFELYGDVFDY